MKSMPMALLMGGEAVRPRRSIEYLQEIDALGSTVDGWVIAADEIGISSAGAKSCGRSENQSRGWGRGQEGS
jgi:hypothetical protein